MEPHGSILAGGNPPELLFHSNPSEKGADVDIILPGRREEWKLDSSYHPLPPLLMIPNESNHSG